MQARPKQASRRELSQTEQPEASPRDTHKHIPERPEQRSDQNQLHSSNGLPSGVTSSAGNRIRSLKIASFVAKGDVPNFGVVVIDAVSPQPTERLLHLLPALAENFATFGFPIGDRFGRVIRRTIEVGFAEVE